MSVHKTFYVGYGVIVLELTDAMKEYLDTEPADTLRAVGTDPMNDNPYFVGRVYFEHDEYGQGDDGLVAIDPGATAMLQIHGFITEFTLGQFPAIYSFVQYR